MKKLQLICFNQKTEEISCNLVLPEYVLGRSKEALLREYGAHGINANIIAITENGGNLIRDMFSDHPIFIADCTYGLSNFKISENLIEKCKDISLKIENIRSKIVLSSGWNVFNIFQEDNILFDIDNKKAIFVGAEKSRNRIEYLYLVLMLNGQEELAEKTLQISSEFLKENSMIYHNCLLEYVKLKLKDGK